ncbi:54S ribosomal protein L37 mitochondrial [Dissostichus eleginoides]|uniref:54S ribosomal protein L37 mitochondrial n=1 Tax=Dissostichus eleginoides TaxID=100907 RepID=A0AAD9BT89_DISEL|nr:54S ribosomal protein L37 mitochondrial [Dissostichus eleginoides]
MEFRMGYRSQDRVRLIASAVPSIHLASLSAPVAAAAGGGGSDGQGSVRDSAPRKRELCTTLGDNGTACHEGTDSPTASDAGLIDPEQEVVSPLVPQPTSVHHCGSQCNLRPFHRSSAVRVQPRMVSVGCQTESPLPSPPAHSDESSSVSMDHPGDMPWSPEEEIMSESSDEEPSKEPLQQTNFDLNAADKFIVCQSQLMSLFTICPACCGETQGYVEQQEGTYIKIKQVCATCGYERFWQNQPMLHRNMPACNLLLSGAIHFSGCMATQTIRMLKLFGLQCISASTFFRHQRLYTIPTIVQAWQNEQAGIIRELKEMGGGLILSGDCRINKVFDLQLVQSSEVPSSTWCELEGLKRSIDFLKEQHMQVSALITDRNRQVAKWVREELCPGGTSHFFDIWHIGKSLGKALDAAAKERECEDLKLWRPAIINHLYQTAASTPDGDPDVMEAKWQSMVNHVQDIHEHGTPAFPCCAHPPLEGQAKDKEWLEPGTTLLMAALHFNHNSSREVARTSDGEVRYAVRYARFCKGGWVVRPIKEKPSYAYAAALMESLREGYSRSPETLRESSAVLSSTAPAPLSTSCQEIAKDEAVGLYLARHSRFNTGN